MYGAESMSGHPHESAPGVMAELHAAGFVDAEEIGRGGFGVVYRCREAALDRAVAVKVLSGALDPDNLERFLREQQAMGRLSGHPHIVNILQVGATSDGRPYIVMQYHPRNSLQELLRKQGPLDWAATLRVGVKMAGALECAHRAGTLHRDVKPANILLTDYGEPQLTDFGIARISGGFETATGAVTGSPAFTAPEVLAGRTPDRTADIYSLGATLFCALTGHAAFERREGEKVVSQFLRITREPIPDLRTDGIPSDVCTVIEEAMAQDPEVRPASAAEFGHALQATERRHGLDVDEMALPSGTEAEVLPDSRDGDATVLRPAVADTTGYLSGRSRRLSYASRRHTTNLTPPAPATRFRPPTPVRALVSRKRLIDLLQVGDRRRLTVIHAPAGYGKSTLAAQWSAALAQQDVAVAWLTVDHDDDNVVWFLSHLVEAIRRVQPTLAEELGQVLEDHGEDAEAYVLTALVNEIHSAGRRVALVIDDWHRVSSPATVAALGYLIQHGCHHLQVVVTSRNRAGLPMSRMRLDDELIEIDSTALRFDSDESRQLLVDLGGLQLAADDVEGLLRSTDGWAAALQLASLSLRGNERPARLAEIIEHLAGHQAIGEFLAENVLDALEPEMLDFLLTTSVSEQTCASLASTLAGVQRGQAILEEVEDRDLFLHRVDARGEWFRYHHLFAEYLRRRLERDQPGRTAELHLAASKWFAERRLTGEAVDQALLGGDPDRAVELVERDSYHLIEHSRMSTLLGLVAKLPGANVARPRLQLAVAWANVLLQRPEAARAALDVGRTAVRAHPGSENRAELRIEANVVRGVMAAHLDRLVVSDKLAAECLARPEGRPPWVVAAAANLASIAALCRFDFDGVRHWQDWSEDHYRRLGGPFSATIGYCFAGIGANEQLDLVRAEKLFRQSLQLAQESAGRQSHAARLAGALLGELFYEQGKVAEAEQLLDESCELGAEGGAVDFMLARYVIGARIKALHGDLPAAAARLANGARAAATLDLPRLRARIENERVLLGLDVTVPPRPPQIETLRAAGVPPIDGIAEITAQLEDATAARLLLRSGTAEDADKALGLARAWVARLAPSGRNRVLLQANRLLTACLFAAGHDDEAKTVLAATAATCADHGMVRYLVDGGPLVHRGLVALQADMRAGRWDESHPEVPGEFLDRVVALAEAESGGPGSGTSAAEPADD